MILAFFKFLQNSNINFCVINGYKEIITPVNRDSDTDILFKKSDFKNIEKILKNFCDEKHIKIVQRFHHDILAKNFFLFNPQNGDFLNLDLYAELSRKGVVFFDEKSIFSTLESYKSIPILSKEKEFINYLIKKLDKNDLKKEHFSHLHTLFIKSEEFCIDELNRFFPKHHTIVIEAFKENDFNAIINNRYRIIHDFYALNVYNLKRDSRNLKRVIKRVLNPTGLTVAFLGPDGSGKSTIIDQIIKNRLPFRRKDYFHLKPLSAPSKKSLTVQNPHEYREYSSGKSYIKLLYFIYQYNMGWLRNILNLKIRSSLVIFDRYYDDLLVDYKRYRYGGEASIAKWVRYFIPTPDLYFILTTEPQIIYKRKQEVPFKELQRQVKSYKKLADGKKYFNIDVNREPAEIAKEITLIMMEKMNERY